MDDDIRLRSTLQTLTSPVDEAAAWASLEARFLRDERSRRARRVVVAVASVAAAIAVTVMLAALPGDEPGTAPVAPPSDPQPTEPVVGERWVRIDSNVSLVPFSGDPVVVNTYDGLLVWGRTAQAHIGRNGRTRPLPPAPIVARDDAGGAWTGSELIVWGGQSELDGAAYDLAADQWREIAPTPLGRGAPIATVWTGAEVLVWGGLPGGGDEGAAYNPVTDSWRSIAVAPFGLSRGNGVLVDPNTFIVLGAAQGSDPTRNTSAQAMQYDALNDTWTVLPEPDLHPNATWMVWTGQEVIAWDYLLKARSYRPGEAGWSILPELPLEGRECYPGGGWDASVGVLVTYCDQVALFDVTSRQWTQEQMPFAVDLNGAERELFGPVEATEDSGVFVLTSEGPLLFR
jgi:hypothetical protein